MTATDEGIIETNPVNGSIIFENNFIDINNFKIEVGGKYRISGRDHMWSSPILHILVIIDRHIVYKRYNRIKQRWIYEIEWYYTFELFIKYNQIRKVK